VAERLVVERASKTYPGGNLDADLRERMRVEISSLVRDAGATTIYITHDQLEAFALADQVGVLDGGVLVQAGTPEEIYGTPASLFVARFTGLAGELAVRVLDARRGGPVRVRPLGVASMRPIDARRALMADDTAEGVLAIRPTALWLCAPEADTAHLVGHVADNAFRGRHYELVVDLSASSEAPLHPVMGALANRHHGPNPSP
jgi:ABC-type Fe3+/spermidine/putrescine transport system ATPase subunit